MKPARATPRRPAERPMDGKAASPSLEPLARLILLWLRNSGRLDREVDHDQAGH